MKNIDINKVDPEILLALINGVFKDYSKSFNELNNGKAVGFNTTLTPNKIKVHDVLLKQGKHTKEELEESNIANDEIEVRYLRVGKYFDTITYKTPILEEFKDGFIYQKLDAVNKVWEELSFEIGDIVTQEELDKETIRRVHRVRSVEVPIYQLTIRLQNQKEVLNDKWWKRILYLDLLNTLLAKGIEYGEVLGLLKRGEEEKAMLAKELGANAKEVLDNNKIVIRSEIPKPLEGDDKAYAEYIAKEKAKLNKK